MLKLIKLTAFYVPEMLLKVALNTKPLTLKK